MNWAEYAKYAGDIIGVPLAIEAIVAFFLESVFIGVWIFGWDKVSRRMHAWSITIVAFATNFSALWILLANGWMQNPVGARIVQVAGKLHLSARMEMVDFLAVLTNPYGWIKFLHTLLSGYVVAAFFVMGVAAWHLRRGSERALFLRSFKVAALFGLASTILVIGTGDFHGAEIARKQPAKLAAMEALWDTQQGAGLSLLLIPDDDHERNAVELITIPKLASLLAYRDPNAIVTGLRDFPRELRPPVGLTFVSFRTMVGMGMLMLLLAAAAVYLAVTDRLLALPTFLRIMTLAIALPYLAGQLGWIVAEVGRQPWIVYGILKTSAAVSSSLTAGQVMVSLALFTVLYALLGVIAAWLLVKFIRQGPPRPATPMPAPES